MTTPPQVGADANPQVVATATPPVERRPPLWEEPAMFALSGLKEAGVRLSERHFDAGEAIYTRGDPDRYLYFLTEGALKIYKSYGHHREAIVTLLEEGNVFGEPTPQARGTHRDSAEASICSRVAAVGKAALEHHLRRDPGCAIALLIAYSQWIQRRERTILRLAHWNIRARLAGALLELAERFGEPREGEVVIEAPLTHRMLADMTASSRAGVSREMARFRLEGLIDRGAEARIVLLDKQRLAGIT
jgi:CRP-like cAMP-binding protein